MDNTNQAPTPNVTQTTDPAQIINLMESAFIVPEPSVNPEIPAPVPTPAPEPTPAPIPTPPEASLELLFQTIMNLATPYIERIVETKFNAMVDNSLILTKLDADIEQKMRDIAYEVASDAVYQHERDNEHWSEDYIEDKVSDAIRDSGLSERRIEEMISDAVDQHTSDTDHKDEGDIEHIVGEFAEANDFLTKENLGETLRGMTFDITARY